MICNTAHELAVDFLPDTLLLMHMSKEMYFGLHALNRGCELPARTPVPSSGGVKDPVRRVVRHKYIDANWYVIIQIA